MESLSWVEEVDFAPGDRAARHEAWPGFSCHRIHDPADPFFETAFGLLWDQFHPHGEMETRETILARLARRGQSTPDGFRADYELVLVLEGDRPAAARDFTVILSPRFRELGALVHLSHNLVLPSWRRCGLAAWMRALPMAVARQTLPPEDLPSGGARVALAAEMEAPDPAIEDTLIRLKAYGKAGFRKVDPSCVHFLQPDFRAPELIANDEERPLPMQLVLRLLPEPEQPWIDGALVREIVTGLYDMYALEFREEFMDKVRNSLAGYPREAEKIVLVETLAS